MKAHNQAYCTSYLDKSKDNGSEITWSKNVTSSYLKTRPRNVVKLINCHAHSSSTPYERSSKENFLARRNAIKQDIKIKAKKLHQKCLSNLFFCLNIQMFLCQRLTSSSYAQKTRMQKKTAAFSSFSASTAIVSRVNEWFKNKFSSRHNILWFVLSGISLKSINSAEGLAFTCNVQKMWDSSDYIMNKGYLLRTKLAKMQDCFFTKHLRLFRICFQSKLNLFFPKKIFSELEILWTGF